MSCGYADSKRWGVALLVALGLFLITRFLTLAAFPIFNDETIYLQYSQRIHDDWHKNKFISMNGEFTDWKPPLQYWLAAPFIEYGDDPLITGRIIAVLISIAGFFGTYLFAKEIFGEREGVIAAFLYMLCPPVLLHNDQFTAETFLFSTASLFYWAALRAMGQNTRPWLSGVLAALLGTALLLFKQSGFSLLMVAILLPLCRLSADWKGIARKVLVVSVIIAGSVIAANIILPSQFNATRAEFNGRWVMSLSEVAGMPIAIWRANLAMVADYIGSYYSWPVLLFFFIFFWRALRGRNFPELTLSLMCLAGAGALTFFLRGFNEYLFNTALIAALLPLLARTGIFVSDFVRANRNVALRSAAIICAGFIPANWAYQDTLMGISAGKYIERSSSWAIAHYLKSWSTGFGIKEIVEMLAKETRPGLVFADSQWGNPRTALEIYGKRRFPQLRVAGITREFLDREETRKLKEFVPVFGPARFAIYSADTSSRRGLWQDNIRQQMCERREEVKAYPAQMPIVVCHF